MTTDFETYGVVAGCDSEFVSEIGAHIHRALGFLDDPALLDLNPAYGAGWLAVDDIGIALGIAWVEDEELEDGIFVYTGEPDDPATRRIIDAIDKALYFLSDVTVDFIEVGDDEPEYLHYRDVLLGAWREVAEIGPALGLDKPGAMPMAPVPDWGIFLEI